MEDLELLSVRKVTNIFVFLSLVSNPVADAGNVQNCHLTDNIHIIIKKKLFGGGSSCIFPICISRWGQCW